MASDLGTTRRGRYSPLATDVTKNPERLIALRGLKGATWFVDSNVVGGASGNGLSWGAAKRTLAEAIAAALADDTILVAAGHAEATITTALTFAVAGVSVYGYGQGERRPKFTFTGNVDVNLDVSGITLSNLVFESGIDAQTIIIDVNAANCVIEDCAFYEGTSIQWVTAVDINGGASNACDNTVVRRSRFQSIAVGADRAIELGAIADGVIIEDCYIDGDFADAGIHNPTGNVLTNLTLAQNTVRNRQTGDHAIELVSACTGVAVDNRLFGDTGAAIFDPGSLFCAGNRANTGIDSVGWEVPGPGEFVPYFGYHVTKSHNIATDNVDLFTVTGKVAIMLWTGEVTTIVATTTTYALRVKTSNEAITAATTITTDAAGTLYYVSGDSGDVMNGADAPTTKVGSTGKNTTPMVLGLTGGSLTVESDLDGAGTGVIRWDVYYIPLEAGASIVAA